ncbi:hypothetical protein LWI28_003192 [Acer negundo]|uniref:Retrovirus-related Pol polyprotein from transposon TNT 1-94-like beta-barrel domain-containing protein n=1 Tax=Acer negundo TaxID=4023 RepID=A0AAD5IH97_ACENE|nr:hypothetical protein LWI28_003192 [Acer negundo]
MISEVYLVNGFEGWWVDTGASWHVCYDRAMFKSYSNVEDKKVLLGDSHSTVVAGSREVELNFASGKTIILKDVLHTPEIRNNLLSGYLLNKDGFTQTIGVDLFTLTKMEFLLAKAMPLIPSDGDNYNRTDKRTAKTPATPRRRFSRGEAFAEKSEEQWQIGI